MESANSLRDWRINKALSQKELSQISGISVRTIQRLETGQSIGSPYTQRTLAGALGVELDHIDKKKTTVKDNTIDIQTLKLINLSALAMLIIPLGNLMFPLILYASRKLNTGTKYFAKKIINLQIMLTLLTLFSTILISGALSGIFGGGGVPIFVPVYLLFLAINTFFILRLAIQLNYTHEILARVPNML